MSFSIRRSAFGTSSVAFSMVHLTPCLLPLPPPVHPTLPSPDAQTSTGADLLGSSAPPISSLLHSKSDHLKIQTWPYPRLKPFNDLPRCLDTNQSLPWSCKLPFDSSLSISGTISYSRSSSLSISSHSGALGSLEEPRPLLRQSTQVPPALPGDLTHTSTAHLTTCVPPSDLSLNSMP